VLDWWYGQTAADGWIESLLDLMAKWKPVTWFGEAGVIRRSVEPFLVKRMRERRVYCHCEWMASIHDKPTRARGIQGRCSMGKLYFLAASDWTERLISQLLRFPDGKFDDGVDVMSLIGRALEEIYGAVVPDVEKKQDEGYLVDDEYDDDDWKTA
jgi:predicted phage terminase large subunit-like protein